MPPTWDIIVVGAGPAGATVAGLLAAGGWRVLVCEGKAFPREKVCGEFMGTRVRPVLRRLGLLEQYDRRAGPRIMKVAAHPGGGGAEEALIGAMPVDEDDASPRAMGRGDLDEMLLRRAAELGAKVAQPCHVAEVTGDAGSGFTVKTSAGDREARMVVLAHGLAQQTGLAGVRERRPLRRRYVSFKAHFTGCDLAPDTIAIGGLAGAYAGLVASSRGRCSLAFVVRRERLERVGNSAQRQFAALLRENAGFARMLRHATRLGEWIASGPLEPGARTVYRDGRFFVGNAAGEVHALAGEGITLAMCGAQILADVLQHHGLARAENIDAAGLDYHRLWRRMFSPRYAAAQVFANLMMRPILSSVAGGIMSAYPELFAACIRRSGK